MQRELTLADPANVFHCYWGITLGASPVLASGPLVRPRMTQKRSPLTHGVLCHIGHGDQVLHFDGVLGARQGRWGGSGLAVTWLGQSPLEGTSATTHSRQQGRAGGQAGQAGGGAGRKQPCPALTLSCVIMSRMAAAMDMGLRLCHRRSGPACMGPVLGCVGGSIRHDCKQLKKALRRLSRVRQHEWQQCHSTPPWAPSLGPSTWEAARRGHLGRGHPQPQCSCTGIRSARGNTAGAHRCPVATPHTQPPT
jgi:hypothetical protein